MEGIKVKTYCEDVFASWVTTSAAQMSAESYVETPFSTHTQSGCFRAFELTFLLCLWWKHCFLVFSLSMRELTENWVDFHHYDSHWRIHIWTSSLGTPILDQLQCESVPKTAAIHSLTWLWTSWWKGIKIFRTFGNSKATQETIFFWERLFFMHICCPMHLPDGPSVEDTPSMEVPQLQGSQRIFDRLSH